MRKYYSVGDISSVVMIDKKFEFDTTSKNIKFKDSTINFNR